MRSFPVFLSLLLLPHICNGFADAACFIHSSANALRGDVTSLQSSNKSVNQGTGDFHYSQQPRGTSFISQVSKRDLEERRQMRPPFSPQPQQWQPPVQPQPQQMVAPQQASTTQAAPQAQMPNNMKEFDSISANIKAMTGLLGDVKESLTVQHADIRWLNKKYQEIEKRLERAEIFNTAISQDVSEMKSSKTSSVNQSTFGPIYGEYEQLKRRENSESHVRDVIDNKDNLNEKLERIKDQMNRLDIAIKVGEVTLSNHMDEVNRRFDNVKNADTDGPEINNINQNQQYQQFQPNTNRQFSQPFGQPNMNQQFNEPQPNNMNQNQQYSQPFGQPIMNQQFNQPQPNNVNQNQQYQQSQLNTNQQFSQPFGPELNQQFNQPPPNNMNGQFRKPHPPPSFEPPPIPNEPSFQMGSFRYEAPRIGRSYEIPSPRQTMPSKSSASYKNQRRNGSFISAISEQELSRRRELFEPVEVMPFVDGPGEYFDDGYDDFYPPDEPFLGEGGYFEEGLYGY
jgi:hypothetical protein